MVKPTPRSLIINCQASLVNPFAHLFQWRVIVVYRPVRQFIRHIYLHHRLLESFIVRYFPKDNRKS